MKPKDIFSLAIRLIGLVFLCRSLWVFPGVILAMFSGGILNFVTALLIVVWPLLVGYWFLQGAPLLMRIAYPDSDSED